MTWLGPWAEQFPAWELTRNITIGVTLLTIILLQLSVLGESTHAEEMAQLGDAIVLLSYIVMFVMFIPAIDWILKGVAYYVTAEPTSGGEPA